MNAFTAFHTVSWHVAWKTPLLWQFCLLELALHAYRCLEMLRLFFVAMMLACSKFCGLDATAFSYINTAGSILELPAGV